MARKRQPHEGKLRTRAHILEDLSINYVERRIFLRGFAVDQKGSDYGIDLAMLTFNVAGVVENGHVLIQVKATDNLKVLKNSTTISLRVEVADLKWWQSEWLPVILIVYDGIKDRAYWLDIQEYLDRKRITWDELAERQDRLTVHIPMKNTLNRRAIEEFRKIRNRLARRIGRGDEYVR